VSWNGYDSK